MTNYLYLFTRSRLSSTVILAVVMINLFFTANLSVYSLEQNIPMSKLKLTLIKELKHQAVCDASASIALKQDHFIVGNDEDNILRIYPAQKSSQPLNEIDINNYFVNNPKQKEVDIEAATEVDGTIYWITSHGANKKGKFKPERHQFFANQIIDSNPATLKMEQLGTSYNKLITEDIVKDGRFSSLNIENAQKIPPKEKGGLNIEGLTTTPDGQILIGFRNPITNDGKAILIPLKNPQDLINSERNENVTAELGELIFLDLGGLGIRSMEYWSTIDAYLIVAGDYSSELNFALYTWTGNQEEKPEKIDFTFPNNFRPESILIYPELKDQLQIISDDGAVVKNGNECKDLSPDDPDKYFRSIWIKLEER